MLSTPKASQQSCCYRLKICIAEWSVQKTAKFETNGRNPLVWIAYGSRATSASSLLESYKSSNILNEAHFGPFEQTPMALSVRYADAGVVRVYDNEYDGQNFGLGPDVKKFLPTTSKTISPPSSSFVDFIRQRQPSHRVSDSITTTSSFAESDEDVEAIELSTLRSPAQTARSRPFVSHERFNSASSASSSSSSSSSCTYGDERSGVRSEPRSSLDHSLTFLEAQIPCSTTHKHLLRREKANGSQAYDSDLLLEDCVSDQSTPPLTPMSLTQTRHGHRLYVPSSSHHDQQAGYNDESTKADLESGFLRISAHKRPDSVNQIPVETDTLLATTSQLSLSLPLPTTAAHPTEPIEPIIYHFSFSLVETAVHVIGVAAILFLVILSMWLTLANVKM